jgi:hypothetical protein
MGENLISRLPLLDRLTDRGYDAGSRNAKRHRRSATDVPLARAYELVPVGDPRGAHLDQDLVIGEGTRIGQVDGLDCAAQGLDTGRPHQTATKSPGFLFGELTLIGSCL